jgi:4-hydroxybenzoate polyprenyltransferase
VDAADGGRRGRLRAWLEVLRAPLLLSPIGDVLAGWCVGAAALQRAGGAAPAAGRALFAAALAGCCLLAAGMLQNALCDLPDDRQRKPTRPLPRGALTRGQVLGAWCLLAATALVLTAGVSPAALAVAVAILLGSSAYNLGLKRHRVTGCAVLGLMRGLDLALGVTVLAGSTASSWDGLLGSLPLLWPLVAVALYAGYVLLAALHASTDDEPPDDEHLPHAAIAQVALLGGALGALAHAPWGADALSLAGSGAAIALLAWAAARVAAARRTGSPPRISGALLSNAVLVTGALAAHLGPQPQGLVAAAIAVVLLRISRAFLQIVPPS